MSSIGWGFAMVNMRFSMLQMLTISLLSSAVISTANAQGYPNCAGRSDFDQCMANINTRNMQQIQNSQQQLFENYVATNQSWLRQNYAAHRANGGQMSPQQFAYWGLMTANGTNIQGAQQAQRDQFIGNQHANRTIQEGNQRYNQGMYDNSRRTSETAERYNQGAIRGNGQYINPYNGERTWLPYSGQPNQPFTQNGNTYMQTPDGRYYQQQGNSWMQMNNR